MEKKLNHLLADLVTEYHKLQSFHWYVKGKDFFTAHAKLEEYYDHIRDAVDEVAENILMMEGKPLSSMKDFIAETSITETENTFKSSEDIFKEVLKDFKLLLAEIKEIKGIADEKESFAISALMDGYIADFTKSIWMLSQAEL